MQTQPDPVIPVSRDTLERMLALLIRNYEREQTREVKQVAEMIQRLLQHTT